MTDTSMSTRLAEVEFRIGRVISRSFSVLSRNFLIFVLVTTIAYLPTLLVLKSMSEAAGSGEFSVAAPLLAFFLVLALSLLSQAVVLYGAFQDMRGRPVRLGESLMIALQRFLPIIGLAVVMSICLILGFMALVIPGLFLITIWFVVMPACVVERLGPFRSMGRSAQLTKGHRWKIFGLMLLLVIISFAATAVIEMILAALGGAMLSLIGNLLWNGVWGAFYAITAVVTYHDLRVAKEGIDIEQIAAVFD